MTGGAPKGRARGNWEGQGQVRGRKQARQGAVWLGQNTGLKLGWVVGLRILVPTEAPSSDAWATEVLGAEVGLPVLCHPLDRGCPPVPSHGRARPGKPTQLFGLPPLPATAFGRYRK